MGPEMAPQTRHWLCPGSGTCAESPTPDAIRVEAHRSSRAAAEQHGKAEEMVIRAECTMARDKMRRGGVPLRREDARAALESGNGRACDGCGEPICQVDRMYVAVIHGVAVLRFHEDCHNATFTR